MEAQEIYNLCAGHLLKQGRQSIGDEGCAYRGDGGLKCVAGAAISNAVYDPAMEGRNISYVVERYAGLHHLIPHKMMLEDLQCLHDCLGEYSLTAIFGRDMIPGDIVKRDGTFIMPILKEGLDNIAKRHGLEPLPPLEG